MKYWRILVVIIMALGIVWVGCSDDDDTGTNGGNGDTTVTVDIGPEGGIVMITGEVTLTIPPGAVTDTVAFSIAHNGSPTPPGGTMCFVTPVYTIEPSGTNFTPGNEPLLAITYSESNLHGADENDVDICTCGGSVWSSLSTTVESNNNMAITEIDHLSDFTVMVDTSSAAEGVYAAMVVSRMITFYGGSPFRMDNITARFDSAYAPCTVVDPQQADSVICNEFGLTWISDMDLYMYMPMGGYEYLELGETYIFDVDASPTVPSLTDSVDFPATETYITSPDNDDNVSLSGFGVTWTGAGAGTVLLVLSTDQADSAVMLEVSNSGSYSFTSDDLQDLQSGEYGLTLFNDNINYIDATGYDPRSYIKARMISGILINLQ